MTREGPEPTGSTAEAQPERAAGDSGDPASDPTAALLDPSVPGTRGAYPAGELLAGRFRIVRFIGGGGMGEVYEAEDLELHERIALKTIRGELAGEPRFVERFRREIQLARRVSHRNVCRTYDLEQHVTEAGARVTFLAMELLEGETLAQRLAREGRLSTEAAWPLVEQMASGLGAAHQAGVVHRDFKPSNALLVPEREGRPRVVVTDFGLARSQTALGGGDMTDAGATLGTAAYMAPEQVEGNEAGPAADIYALGVVLYEMVTGRKPFVGTTPLSTAVKRIKEAPLPPRTHVPDLHPRWEKVILRCLEKEPAARFARAEEVARALPEAGSAAGPRRRAGMALAAAAMAAAALAVGLLVRERARPRESESGAALAGAPPLPSRLRRSVAVIGFKNLSGRADTAWVSTALGEMIGSELAMGGALRVIPGENVARMKVELALREAETLSAETARRVRRNLGADVLITGSYLALGERAGGRLRVDLRLQDAATGESMPPVIESASESELADLVGRAGSQLRQRLGLGDAVPPGTAAARASLPSNPEAARLYAEGLARLRVFDALAARDLLQRAVVVEPTHPLIHDALAEAWGLLGYEGRRRQEARRAFEECVGLSREEKLVVEGHYRETMREWAKAAETYRALWGFYPDNLEYGLRLASTLRTAGQASEALGVLDALRRLPSPAGDDPRIDLAEAETAIALFDHRRGGEAARRAAEKAAQRAARLVVARARALQGWATQMLGEPARARELLSEARRLFEQAGDQRGLAYALHISASALDESADFEGARRLHEQALAIRREIGDEAGVATTLNNLAVAQWDQDDLRGAREAFEGALASYRRIDDRYAMGMPVANLALVVKDQGELARARRMLEEAIPGRRAIGDRRGLAFMLGMLGQALLAQGELAEARRVLEEGLELCREAEKRLAAYLLFALGEIARAEGDLAGARRQHEEALAIREKMDARLTSAESRVALALLSIDEGRPEAGAAAVADAAAVMQSRRAPCKEALARAVLALAESSRDAASARRELVRAADVGEGCQAPVLRLSSVVVGARAEVALGRAAPARARLRTAAAEARGLGLLPLELEARLALAGLAPESERGRALHEVAAEARRRGQVRLMRAAEAAQAALHVRR